MTIQPQHTHPARIGPATQVGLVSLTVADLDRSVAFYTDALGFAVLQQNGPAATLGVAGTPLLVLTEHIGARLWPETVPAVVVRDPWQNTILLRIGSASDARAATIFMAAVPMG